MTSLLQAEKETFFQQLNSQYDSLNSKAEFHKIRKKSWNQLLELGLPTRKSEVYRYVKLRKLYSESFQLAEKKVVDFKTIEPFLPKEGVQPYIVLINGYFYPEFSNTNKELEVLSLADALKTYGTLLNNRVTQTVKEEKDPFVLLNGAFHKSGAFIYIPPRIQLEKSLNIYHFIDGEDRSLLLTPRIHLFVGKHSEVNINYTHQFVSGESFFSNQSIDLMIEEGAQVKYNQLTIGSPKNGWMFSALRSTLKKNSRLQTTSFTDGSVTVRDDYHVQLAEENAEVSLNGLWGLKGRNESHTHVYVDHQAPHCRSMQLFKGVLNDQSHSSFEGKIYVRQAAQKTDAFQLNNNLLLSSQAQASSKPNLEIFADDVKASHGSTVGQVDAEELFYLRARGYSKEQAKAILVEGFCREVINLIEDKPLRKEIQKQLIG